MTDHEQPTDDQLDADAETALAEDGDDEEVEEDSPEKLTLTVNVEKSGPCRRHVKVTIPREDIDRYHNLAVKEFVQNAAVPGFRPGRVPRTLIERRFKTEVGDKVKQQLLFKSLEQVETEQKLDAISEPDLKLDTLTIPDEGDFEYEFDVEVRPEFDLPDYAGLSVDRPTREVTDEDVALAQGRYLSSRAEMKVVEEPAQPEDFVVANLTIQHGEKLLGRHGSQTVRIRPILRFQDAEVTGFDTALTGVTAGETRTVEAKVSVEAAQIELRGEMLQVELAVKEVRRLVAPELTTEFLARAGVQSAEELAEEIRSVLERQLVYEQRQSVRNQVLDKIVESANWDLPEALVRKQVDNALRREVLEMQQAGFSDHEIRSRENELRQNSITETRKALKQHFILDKIAQTEKIEVTPDDIESEIYFMAQQRGESPRRVRARLDKSGMIENLSAQILERKAVDIILSKAKYNDVPMPARDTADRYESLPIAACGVATDAAATEAEGTDESAAGGSTADA